MKVPKQMTPQCERVLKRLQENGKINPLEALQYEGVYRLSDTIYKLRNLGYEIVTQQTSSFNRFKEKVRFATYILKDKK